MRLRIRSRARRGLKAARASRLLRPRGEGNAGESRAGDRCPGLDPLGCDAARSRGLRRPFRPSRRLGGPVPTVSDMKCPPDQEDEYHIDHADQQDHQSDAEYERGQNLVGAEDLDAARGLGPQRPSAGSPVGRRRVRTSVAAPVTMAKVAASTVTEGARCRMPRQPGGRLPARPRERGRSATAELTRPWPHGLRRRCGGQARTTSRRSVTDRGRTEHGYQHHDGHDGMHEDEGNRARHLKQPSAYEQTSRVVCSDQAADSARAAATG